MAIKFLYSYQKKNRKEKLCSPKEDNVKFSPPVNVTCGRKRAFLFAPRKGSLTVEAAVVLPVFFLVMAATLQLGNVMETAVRFGSALSETGEEIAIAAYAREYSDSHAILRAGLSAAYAQGKVMSRAGDTGSVKNVNFLLSSFLEEEDGIDLIMTYRIRSVIGGVKIPGIFFVQRGYVRGWTGRKSSDGGAGTNEEGKEKQTVYVTDYGTVYHTDINCTHIKLSIRLVQREDVDGLRNSSGEKYHSCELCGGAAGGSVYITQDGNRYHSSLECSGLKRSVHEVSLEELGNRKPCSRCGKLM